MCFLTAFPVVVNLLDSSQLLCPHIVNFLWLVNSLYPRAVQADRFTLFQTPLSYVHTVLVSLLLDSSAQEKTRPWKHMFTDSTGNESEVSCRFMPLLGCLVPTVRKNTLFHFSRFCAHPIKGQWKDVLRLENLVRPGPALVWLSGRSDWLAWAD
jgi:hypothetical protein